MRYFVTSLSLACCLATAPAIAADAPAGTPSTNANANNRILVAKAFRTSKLTGLNVRNSQGEKLGTVNDLVVNIETGKIAYVALSYGGVLGIGDKLFAVPFSQLKFDHGKDEMFFVLDMPKEKLQAAPGFDQSDWPNFADPTWSEKIDNYYRRAQTTTGSKEVAR
jgi:sporulation protein YlmC with PRC-barrel domain